jgi:Pectate lyase superfamily protein
MSRLKACFGWLVAGALLAAGSANAQSVPLTQNGAPLGVPWYLHYVPTVDETLASYAAKADVVGGTLTNPTIAGGALTAPTIVGATETAPTITGGTIDYTSAINQVATGGTSPMVDSVRYAATVDARDFGAVCNNSGDDTAALQRAFTAASSTARITGAAVQLPTGTCVISAALAATVAPGSAQNFALRGWGMGVSFIKVISATDGIDITLSRSGSGEIGSNFDLRDFTIYTMAAVNPSLRTAGIKITGAQGVAGDGLSYSHIRHVHVAGGSAAGEQFFNGIDIEQVSSVAMDQLFLTTNRATSTRAGNGVLINGGNSSTPYTSYNLNETYVNGFFTTGILLANNLQGVDIERPVMTGLQDGVDWLYPTIAGAGTLFVHGGVLEISDYGVHTDGIVGVDVGAGILIMPYPVAPVASGQWYGVYINHTGQSTVANAQIGNFTGDSAVTNGIYLFDDALLAGDIIADNRMSLLSGFGIETAALASTGNPYPIMVHGNSVMSTVTPFSNTASPGQVIDQDNCFSTTKVCVNTGSTTDINYGGSGIFSNNLFSMLGLVQSGNTTTGNASQITGTASGGTPALLANGIDANISLKLIPKGSGVVSMSSHLATTGLAPVLTGCGASPAISTTATDVHGTITEGAAATGCVATFAVAFATAPDCVVTSPTGSALTSYAVSATALTVVNASATGDRFAYHCVQ